jgi:hypothetical protein
VEGHRTETSEARSPEARENLIDEGYDVVGTYQEDIEYRLERRERVSQPSTERRTFESRAAMRRFLETVDGGWRSAGSVTVTETERVTETVWRDSRHGDGMFTGETRRVVPEDAETVVERKFVEHFTERVEVRERVTVRRPTGETEELVVTRTETVNRKRTYWAETAEASDHERTGETREVVADGSPETEYQFRVERTEERHVQRYAAERTTYETVVVWQDAGTVQATESGRQSVRQRNDVRIAEATQRTVWRLEREWSGSRMQTEYQNAGSVNRTVVYVSGEILHRDIEADTTEVIRSSPNDSPSTAHSARTRFVIESLNARGSQSVRRTIR